MGGVIMRVALTRTELVALQETIELTPVFEGRTEARDAIREVLREGLRERRPPSPLRIEETTLAALTQRIVPIDVRTAVLRSKLNRELQQAQAVS